MELNDGLLVFAVSVISYFALMQSLAVNRILRDVVVHLASRDAEDDLDESTVLVRCDVCGWSVNAVLSGEQEFPIECHNCGINAVEPVEEDGE